MELMNMTSLCDIGPMIDDLKVLARCISLWKSHPAGRPNEVWALDMVFQDAQWIPEIWKLNLGCGEWLEVILLQAQEPLCTLFEQITLGNVVKPE
ncbi:hypothetical protein Tco_0657720 [Tanacetum coccineum]